MYFYKNSELEKVFNCPICDSSKYINKFYALNDYLVDGALNQWQMVECKNCHSLYLKKRPKKKYLNKAYSSYYTHEHGGLKSRIKKQLLKFFIYFFVRQKISKNTWLPWNWFPHIDWFDSKTRHLRIMHEIKPCKSNVLDVGCGNGDFLEILSWLGINGFGIDFDESAIAVSTKRSFVAQKKMLSEVASENQNFFDLITGSHVIEHLYEVESFFFDCYVLLKPNGRLWIQFPNSIAKGLELYGIYWRGLEAPRHLCIPSKQALLNLAKKQGFELESELYDISPAFFMVGSSEKIKAQAKNSSLINTLFHYPYFLIKNSFILFFYGFVHKERQEFTTLIFKKHI